jgi:hypothetical protein
MKNKKIKLLFFLSWLFLLVGFSNAKAAIPSQCQGSCGEAQTCTNAAGFTEALKAQCENQFETGCNSMAEYLQKLTSDCVNNSNESLVAGNCQNIEDGNKYGACAAAYAGSLGGGNSNLSNSNVASVAHAGTNVIDYIPTSNETGLSDKSIKDILTNLLDWLLGIVGVIALISFAVSGIMYLVSTGNDEVITKAKKYMLYSIIGVIVTLASFVIIRAIDAILWGEWNI